MTEHQLELAAQHILMTLKDLAPYDTGNLALNSIRMEKTAPYEYRIYVSVDGDHTPGAMDGIAPYMVYVNENQTVGASTVSNRNYHWWEAAVQLALEEGAKFLQGEIK